MQRGARRGVLTLAFLATGYAAGRGHAIYDQAAHPEKSVSYGLAGLATDGELALAERLLKTGNFSKEDAHFAAAALMNDFQRGAVADLHARMVAINAVADVLVEQRRHPDTQR